MARIELDTQRCSGHAMCNSASPDVFDLDDGGYCVLTVTEVDSEARESAIAGINACPEQALRLLGDDA